MCCRPDDLLGLCSIVDIWVVLQNCSEEPIGRHIDAFGLCCECEGVVDAELMMGQG